MSETLIGALIGIGGVIIGAVLSFVFQLIIDKNNNKKENRRTMYQLKIDTYADAIRYISLCCIEYQHKDSKDYKKLITKSDELYKKFHPILSIIATKDVIEKYNELRNKASDGIIKNDEAYKKVIEILNFNINDEI